MTVKELILKLSLLPNQDVEIFVNCYEKLQTEEDEQGFCYFLRNDNDKEFSKIGSPTTLPPALP